MRDRHLVHWFVLAAIVMLWGSAFGLTKLALEGLTPLALVTFRLLLAASLLLGMVWWRGERLPRSRRFWLFNLAMAVIGNSLPFYLIAAAQEEVDSGLAGILMSVMPLATLVLAHWFVPGERLTLWKLIGFAIGFIGIVVLTGPEAFAAFAGQGKAFWLQSLLLISALCYALNAIIARHRPSFDPILAAAGTMSIGALIMIPLGIGALPAALMTIEANVLLAAMALAVMANAAAPVLFLHLVSSAGPSFASLINYLVPLWAMVVGIVLLGETLPWRAPFALLLILAGIACSGVGKRPATPKIAPRLEGGD